MKFVRLQANQTIHLGVIDGDHVVDILDALEADGPVSDLDQELLADMAVFITSRSQGERLAERALELSAAKGVGRRPISEVRLYAPIIPESILCVGKNYQSHLEDAPLAKSEEPEFFLKTSRGIISPGDAIVHDKRISSKLDYETELAVIIGGPVRHIPARYAMDFVYGYTILNDVSARDRLLEKRPDGSFATHLGPGKNFESCAPMGPCIATVDDIPDPHALGIRTLVNGDVRQDDNTANMIHKVADIISYLSSFFTLVPGQVIATGTPGGTAWSSDPELGGKLGDKAPGGYLQPGDQLRCEIDGIGVLENPVVAVPEPDVKGVTPEHPQHRGLDL